MAGSLNKSVSLRIVTDSGNAKEQLDDIMSKADYIDGKKSSLQVNVRAGDTKEQLDDITDRAAALGIKRVSFKVVADTKKANAELEITESRIDKLNRKLKETAAEASAGEAALGLFRTGLFALAPAAIPVVGVATAFSASLLPAVASAGIGVGLFAKVAQASLSGLSKNIDAMTTAQDEFNNAVTSSQLAKATKDQNAALKGLSDSQQQLVFDAADAKLSWQGFIKSSADGVDNTLLPALGMIPTLLKDATKFLVPTEAALGGLGEKLSKAVGSKGGQDFIGKLASLSGKSITGIGTAIGNVAKGVGGLFKDIMPEASGALGLIDKGSAAFAKWGTSAGAANGVKSLFGYFSREGPVVGRIIKQLGEEVPKIVKAFTAWGGASLSGISVILTVIGKLSPGQLTLIAGGILAISAATKLWAIGTATASIAIDLLAKRTVIATALTKGWAIAQGIFNAIMDANPAVLIITAIGLAIVLVVKYHTQLWKIAKLVWHDFLVVAEAAWNGLKRGFDIAFGWIKKNWPLILGILTGPIGIAVVEIVKHWHSIESGLSRVLSNVMGWFKALPGRILGALGNLGSLLWSVGKSIISGLIGGIESKFDAVKSTLGKLTSWIPQFKGPPARDKVLLRENGQLIMDGLLGGITSRVPNLRQTLGNVTRAVQTGVTPHVSASGRGTGNVYITNNIKVDGVVGDAGATGRKIVQTVNEYFRQTGQGQLATSRA